MLVGSWFPDERSVLNLWGLKHSVQETGLPENSWPKGILVRSLMKASTCIQDLAPPSCQQHPAQDASPKQQARQKQTQSLADTLPTDTWEHTTWHSPAHQREENKNKKPHLLHQNTSPSQHEAYTNHWTNFTIKSRKGRRNTILKSEKRRPQKQSVIKKWKDREILYKWRNKVKTHEWRPNK